MQGVEPDQKVEMTSKQNSFGHAIYLQTAPLKKNKKDL